MSSPYVLAEDRFAAWARTNGVRLPDPLDVTRVDAVGADVPVDDPTLERLAAVLRAARAEVFLVELVPGRGEVVTVAVAAEWDAALVRTVDATVVVAPARPDELVRALSAWLPELPSLAQAHVQMPEQHWNALLQQVATDASPGSALTALQRAGIGEPMSRAMLAAKQHPVPIGLLGAAARADAPAAALQRGPTLASWFAYPGGAVLATLLAPRRGGPRTVHLEPYTVGAAARALAEALPAAHRAADRDHFGMSAHARARQDG